MKRSLTKAGTRSLWLGLAAFAAVGWSCSRTDEPAINEGRQTEGTITQARSFYESTAPSMTKTVADQTIAIKPLPGEMTPLWDQATATVLADGTTAWVDVPIQTTTSYTAVREGHHHHEAGEPCGHDHSSVQAVQNLTIHTAADGAQQCLIATIVPEPDCTVDGNGFSSTGGLSGFSGFVSWHDLTGKLVRVAKYENGTKTQSVEATEGNELAILEVVDNAVLYPSTSSANTLALTKGYNDPCIYCGEMFCLGKDKRDLHCIFCGRYNNPGMTNDPNSKCTCNRCPTCGQRISAGAIKCSSCGSSLPAPYVCAICGRFSCSHKPGGSSGGGDISLPTAHEDMITAIFGAELSNVEFKQVRGGSNYVDVNHEYQNAGYENTCTVCTSTKTIPARAPQKHKCATTLYTGSGDSSATGISRHWAKGCTPYWTPTWKCRHGSI